MIPGSVDPLIGKVLADRFEILARIGEGGMGVVYRARQLSVDRPVAIKVLSTQAATDPTWVQRFINEAKACSKLQHPNTIRLIDFGQSKDGLLFIAMELLDGMSLRQALERGGAMPAARVLKIVAQACQSLAEAHAQGIIHRDIKPDNLFLIEMSGTPDFLKVLDFSVAKLRQQGGAVQTQAGAVFGTPQYMSPEQGRGLPLDARSDIYSLGIVAYEMLTGRAPFASQNPLEVLAMHARNPVPPLAGIPDRAARLVMRALAKDASQRQQAIGELEADCQAALAELSSGAASVPGSAPAPAAAKTMFAASPDAFQLPNMPPAPPSVPPSAAPPPPAAAKTMFAASPDAFQLPGIPAAPSTQPAGATAPPATDLAGGSSPTAAKTIMAADVPDIAALVAAARAEQAAQAAAPETPAAASEPAAPTGGAQKTMFLESSEGVVSFAREGRMPAPAGGLPATGAAPAVVGASPLFWAACIATGLGVGVLAYVVIAKLAA